MNMAFETLAEHVAASGRRTVSAAVSVAASAGIAAYARGGNAFDAALAACFVETVALPMKCGLAGDLVALFRERGGPVRALVSVGGAPAAVDGGPRLERLGPLSVGVPGAPAGYAALLGLARLDAAALVQPALAAARDGVHWTRVGLGYLAQSRELLARWSPGCVYLAQPEPAPGTLLRLPGLAQLLQDFVAHGAALFHGAQGEQLVQALQARGGMLTLQDLRAHAARWCEPVALALAQGGTLVATPAPTQGPALLEVVRRLQQAPGLLASRAQREALQPWDDSALARIVTAVRGEARAAQRLAEDGGTSVVTAADEWGNAVVVVHSNSFPRFGSGVVLDSGLVLNNRPGRGFDPEAAPGAAGAAAAGKVPPTTLQAWALLQPQAHCFGGTPGGVNPLVWNSQTLASLLAGLPAQRVVVEPRWSLDDQGGFRAEPGVVLDAAGIDAAQVPLFGNGSVQQIVRIAPDGRVSGYADPRAGGTVLALT